MASFEKLVIDTDTGIDDALALFLAFSSNTLAQLLAVTCCFGNTDLDNACKNVMRVLHLLNVKDVPIHKGSKGPLLAGQREDLKDPPMGQDGLGNRADEFPTGNLNLTHTAAAVALVQLTLEHPGRINLVAIGPLTNIALAQRIDPQFTRRLKSLVIMGGTYKGIGNVNEVAEFNFYLDPEAAEIVLGEAECPITLVPWETAFAFGPDWDTYDQLTQIQTPKGIFFKLTSKYLADRGFKKGNKRFCDCDLLAVVALLYPWGVTDTIENSLAVECEGTLTRGMTILLDDKNPAARGRKKATIITGFDLNLLNKLRFDILQK